MTTNKQQLWQQYHAAVKAGRHSDAKVILQQIHRAPVTGRTRPGGCSRCKKRFN